MNRYFSTPALVLIIFLATTISAGARLTESEKLRLNYNLTMIMNGISFYYTYKNILPRSLELLIDDGWVPGNLVDPYTGNIIQTDACDEYNYGYAISSMEDSDGIQLKCVRSRGCSEFDLPESKYEGVEGAFEDRIHAMGYLYLIWANQAIQTYEELTGELPGSIEELQGSGYWPFEGVGNLYERNEPIKFDSQTKGNMYWIFKRNYVHVEVWKESYLKKPMLMSEITYPPLEPQEDVVEEVKHSGNESEPEN